MAKKEREAPILAAIHGIESLVNECTVEVERVEKPIEDEGMKKSPK
jgi:hypothetical protein